MNLLVAVSVKEDAQAVKVILATKDFACEGFLGRRPNELQRQTCTCASNKGNATNSAHLAAPSPWCTKWRTHRRTKFYLGREPGQGRKRKSINWSIHSINCRSSARHRFD